MANHKKKQVKIGKDTLALSIKIYNYQKDLISAQDLEKFENKIEVLKNALSIKPVDTGIIAQAVDSLDSILKKHGGSFYPKKFAFENVEMLLVAAILVIGIRSFFFQPFVIPTNSMFPTFNGMTYTIHEGDDTPNPIMGIFNYAIRGFSRKTIEAPNDGKLSIPVQLYFSPDGNSFAMRIPSQRVRGLSRIMLPTQKDLFTIKIGSTIMDVKLPAEFRFEKVLQEKFFQEKSMSDYLIEQNGHLASLLSQGIGNLAWIELPTTYKQGDTILNFDIVSGDALFVDRISYHFVSPKVGDPIVFKTTNVPGLVNESEKYYIKRLVGKGGDVLKIEDPVLYRNGEPISGVEPFKRNHEMQGKYSGYIAEGDFLNGAEIHIPENSYMAMGDNSSDSKDGRYWGHIPHKEVLGRALFIYYPFSNHWGLAE